MYPVRINPDLRKTAGWFGFGRSGFIPTGFYEKQRVGRSGFIPTIAIRDKIFIPYSSGLPCEGISTSSNYFRNVELYD